MSTPAAVALDGAKGTPAAGATPAASAPPAGSTPTGGTTTPAANQPFFDSWFKADAPEAKETREWLANKNYSDPAAFVKSARELESSVASLRAAANLKGYPDPAKADENARKAWNVATGVPERADQYDIPVPANNPYPQFKTYMAEAFHKAGVPAAMAGVIAKGYEDALAKMETEIRASEDSQSKAGLLTLQQEWGAKYQENLSLANRARELFTSKIAGFTVDKERAMESILGTPTWLNFLAEIGRGNKEPGFAGGDAGNGFGNNAEAAQTELNAITARRTAGEIKDYEWREISKPGGKLDQLRDAIVGGMAPMQ